MQFEVNTKALKGSAKYLNSAGKSLKSASTVIASVEKSLDASMESYGIITGRLRTHCKNLSKISVKSSRLQKGLVEIAELYQQSERSIKVLNKAPQQIGQKGGEPKDIDIKDVRNFSQFKEWLYDNVPREQADRIIDALLKTGAVSGMNFAGLQVEILHTGTKSKKGGSDAEAGVYRITIPGKQGKYHADAVIEVGQADAGATGKATLKDGIKGDASAETSGLKLKINRGIGTKNNNVYETWNINILDARAYAKGHADKDGLGFSVGGRADLASIDHEYGVTVGGVRASAAGGAFCGAGAVAKADIGRGVKAKAGLGAGLGLNVEAGVEIPGSYDDSENGPSLKKTDTKAQRNAREYTAGGGGFSAGGGGKGSFGGKNANQQAQEYTAGGGGYSSGGGGKGAFGG